MSAKTCYYCSAPAVVLCDFLVSSSSLIFGNAGPLQTCDRPICGEHRRRVGHVCDRSRRTKNNQSNTIDHCKEHHT